jgi:GTP-binding protein
MDQNILKILKKAWATNYILVANKCDNEDKVMQSYSLAWKWELEFFPISTSHNAWIKQIKDFSQKFFREKWLNYFVEEFDEKIINLSLVWRPIVGKSSLIIAITWKNRVMVKDLSWTTRDSIDTKFEAHWKEFVLIDTAWIRRLSKIWTRNIENWSVMRTTRAINRSDIVAVVVDWIDWVVHQDLAIISKVLEEKKWLIIVVNKWDKVLAKPWVDKEKMMEKYAHYLNEKIEFISYAPIVFSSATEWKRVDEIIENALHIKDERNKRVKTSILNEFLEQVIYKHAPTGNKKSHSPKIYYWTQADTNPPKFVLTVNNPNHFHFSYKRYLENRIRENFWFHGTPIVITYKWRWKHKDVIK